MTVAIDPRGMSFEEWSDRMNLELDSIRPAQKFQPGDDWREWATELIDSRVSQIVELKNIPDPYGFEDWREWASHFNQYRPAA